MDRNYVLALRDSLEKKIGVLDEIFRISTYQSALLQKSPLDYAKFDHYVKDKDICIEKLEKLDEGFETIYERVGEALKTNPSAYATEITQMKELIRQITDKSVEVQALEERNRKAMEQAILTERKELGKGKRSVSVAQKYYRSMSNLDVNSSRYMDQKK